VRGAPNWDGVKRPLLVVALAAGLVLAAAALATAAAGPPVATAAPDRQEEGGRPDERGRPPWAGPPTTTTSTTVVDTEEEALRLNHLQSRGTHNSYHRDPKGVVTDGAPFGWGYSHRTLTGQLEEQGVRQVELDVHWNWATDDFDVYHAWFGDDRSTCDTLTACLRELRAWSDDHPAHAPLMVLVEPKDGMPPSDLPEDGDPFTKRFDARGFQRLDEVVRDAWPDRVVTPDAVTRPGADLRTSIVEDGWPLLDAVRQHALFVIDGDADGAAYSGGWSSLSGRPMFVQAPDDSPVAAFVGRDGARLPGEGKYDRMRRLVAAGFLVRDLASPSGFEAAKAGGAHFISTDFPDDLALSGDPAAPSRCNPVTAPVTCADRAVEAHEPHGYEVPPDPSDEYDQVLADKVDRLVVRSAASAAAATTAEPGSRTPFGTSTPAARR
jgi:hypothetical protein